jgi:hypothetical protein
MALVFLSLEAMAFYYPMKNIFRFHREFNVHKYGLEFNTYSVMSDWKAGEKREIVWLENGLYSFWLRGGERINM